MKRKKNNHLAEGEVTGHFHKAIGGEVFEEAYGDTSLKLSAPKGSIIEHQEHKETVLPPETYRTGKVLEFDPAAEEAREVRD